MPTVILQTQALRVSIGRQEILKGCTLSVGTGVTVILGQNGAGKSTLLRTVTGLLPASPGTVTINGYDLHRENQQARASLGYLPQNESFPGRLTVQESLQYAAWLHRVPGARVDGRIDELLEDFDLGEQRKKLVAHLSGGMRQRLFLAHALVHEPQLLLLDEPTVGLDLAQQTHFRRLVRRVAAERAVVITSHIGADVKDAADTVAVMADGVVVSHDSLQQHLQHWETSGQDSFDQYLTQLLEQAEPQP